MNFSPLFLQRVAQSSFVKQLEQGTLTIDNSEYSNWDACFAKGLYAGALKRVGARSRTPLAFGGAVHAGIDQFLKGNPKWMDAALADAAVTELDSMGDPKRNTTTLQNLLHSYTLEYQRRPDLRFKILNIDGEACIEKSFVVPLGSIGVNFQGCQHHLDILWAGKMDLLTDYEGSIAPVDHKTTSMLGERFTDDKQRSSQMLGYTFAAKYFSEQLFKSKPVFGVRINALHSSAKGFEFKIFDIPINEWKVAEWQQETLAGVGQLVKQLDSFLRDGAASPTRECCVTKYGKCAYFDVCDSPVSMRDRFIFDDSYFYESKWSPLD